MSARYSLVGAVDAERRFPHSCVKLARAEEFLQSGRRHFACRHVLASTDPVLCTDHLALGLRCDPCMRLDHVPRHSEEAEFTCDECGQVAGSLHTLVSFLRVSEVRIREPRGRAARYTGPVSFIAVGVCPSCWRPA
ncbi:MAG: hypothetical protein M3450_05745 [Actinomycetota bacterium]|nr:hypothetical protein [Actinomycetota bacterium]